MQSSQPAYRPNRSTTDYVFTSKLIIVRTVTARNESAHLIMLDIRKAFHSINKLTQKSRFTKHSLDWLTTYTPSPHFSIFHSP